MIGAAARSSRAKGWKLIALALAILVVLYLLFDLGAQFRLRDAARQAASAASQALLQRPQPRPNYPRANGRDQDDAAARGGGAGAPAP